MAVRLGFKTGYEGDEVAVGIALAIALHAIPIAALAIKAAYPSNDAPETELVAKPVIAASLLKLGKPLDPKKLPDRLAPVKSTTNIKDPVASQNDPTKNTQDAGPPSSNAEQADLQKLMNKTDPFAEDAGKPRVEEGFANGSDAGNETDPNKVHAGDQYASISREARPGTQVEFIDLRVRYALQPLRVGRRRRQLPQVRVQRTGRARHEQRRCGGEE